MSFSIKIKRFLCFELIGISVSICSLYPFGRGNICLSLSNGLFIYSDEYNNYIKNFILVCFFIKQFNILSCGKILLKKVALNLLTVKDILLSHIRKIKNLLSGIDSFQINTPRKVCII